MRVLSAELKKLFMVKHFCLIVAAVLVLNAYLMFRTANSEEYTYSDYRKVFDILDRMTDVEKSGWIEEQLNDYSEAPEFKMSLLYEIHDDCTAVLTYKDYLENIKSQAESMTSVSIFSRPDTFNYRNIVKTPPAYESVQNVNPTIDRSKGITLATNNSFTDILCSFILLFAVLSVMISDREQGMSTLLFSLKRGRSYLLITKFAALGITVFLTVLLLYTENLILNAYMFGLGNMSRPIQSVSGFIGCNLRINVWQYLVLYIFFKSIVFFGIAAILSFVAVNTKNSLSFYGISAAVVVIEGVLYVMIPPLSIYSVFRYINLIAFTRTNEIFCNYRNINFWGYPISLIPASVCSLLIITIVFILLSVVLYIKNHNVGFRKIGSVYGIFKGKKVHSRIWYTLYKSLILQKGLAVIFLFLVISGMMTESFVKKYNQADVYYEYYTKNNEGPVTSETIAYFESEAARFDDLRVQIDELQQTDPDNYISINELSKKLAPSMGFNMAYERLKSIQDIDNAYMFYDTGYKRALGVNGYNDDMKYALMAVLCLLFLISPLIANDNKYRFRYIVTPTVSGMKCYISRNIAASVGYAFFVSMLWIIPYGNIISEYYGHGGLNGSIRSITDFKGFPVNIKVWQYILLIALLRTIFLIISGLVMLWVSSNCRNTTYAILINFALFALPIIIYLLGAKIMAVIGFCPLLSVNALKENFSVINSILLSVILIFFIINDMRRKKNMN